VRSGTRAVSDTHALVFHAAGTGRLGPKAASLFAAAEAREATIYLPAAVIWETCLLARAMRINLRRTPEAFFADLFSNPSYQSLPLLPAQIFDADALRFTRDPFDGLICAAARSLNLPLITRDAAIAGSGVVATVW
jgi:PIN domain nuclease of toxin-antitoxin system